MSRFSDAAIVGAYEALDRDRIAFPQTSLSH